MRAVIERKRNSIYQKGINKNNKTKSTIFEIFFTFSPKKINILNKYIK